jgi:hypothetical protein
MRTDSPQKEKLSNSQHPLMSLSLDGERTSGTALVGVCSRVWTTLWRVVCDCWRVGGRNTTGGRERTTCVLRPPKTFRGPYFAAIVRCVARSVFTRLWEVFVVRGGFCVNSLGLLLHGLRVSHNFKWC